MRLSRRNFWSSSSHRHSPLLDMYRNAYISKTDEDEDGNGKGGAAARSQLGEHCEGCLVDAPWFRNTLSGSALAETGSQPRKPDGPYYAQLQHIQAPCSNQSWAMLREKCDRRRCACSVDQAFTAAVVENCREAKEEATPIGHASPGCNYAV